MHMNIPPGRILDKRWFPLLVMEDRVGVFVLSGKFRHYCLHVDSAREMAATLSAAETKDTP